MDTNTDIILKTKNLISGYGRTTVLQGVDIEVPRNAVTTIIGPNGAGKSTLFRTLFGMLPAREGSIFLDDVNITNMSPMEKLKHGIAYVPQGRNIFPELTVESNLELGGVTLRDLKKTRRRMERVMEHFPILKERAKAQASTLSGGEQKMLEIGRALLLNPTLLLVDEPSIGLAPVLITKVFNLLLDLRTNGVTILMIEQNAKKALGFSDFGIVLQQGKLALDGTAQEILNHPEIGHLFLGGAVRVDSAS